MRRPATDGLITPGLAVLAFVLALIQRPGVASSDTKIGLHVDPVGFLGDVASAWSPTEDLGHVQGGQYGGYLFPMGPFFALGRIVGLAPWLVQRLWLGAVLAVAAWGTVRLLDALAGRPRGAAHLVAGLLILLNPYVAVFTARTSVTLLGYAALPWLLLCVHRGLRAPRSWWWPAAFALAVACTGGGVNAAVTAWVLLGPVLLAGYERLVGGVGWRALLAFGWRTALLAALGAVWWVVPTLVQARHGVDFLRFTEQPGTIWSTTSLSESLRLMGYWISYLGVGYGGRLQPLFSDGGVLLFSWPVVVAGLLVPAIALTGFVLARRARYGPFFLLLALAGLLAMVAGFPEGTPLRRAMNFTYNHVAPLQFLRTTYKAGPLAALGFACLAGIAAQRALPWLRARRRWAPGAAVTGLALLAAVACWPLVRGKALDSQLTWERIPPAWEAAAEHVDRTAGTNARAVVLPGQLYAYYDWGGTVDAILPALAERPVAVRYAVPYADLRAVDLLWTVDALVQQRRALPGQLGPLLDLLGARTVVAGADDDRSLSGAVPAADAADVLDQLGRPDQRWGPVRRRPRAAGTLGARRPLPQVRAWDRPGARPIVRVEPDRPATILDGSAGGLAALSAFGALPRRGSLVYAGDLPSLELQAAAEGAEVVISDSNRRQVFAAARMAQNRGATLAADDPFSADAAVVDLFPQRGADGQTVAVYDGIAYLRSPYSPAYSQFPERRPFAALDGDTATHWQADRALAEPRHWLEVGFDRPRDVAQIRLMPYSDERGRVTAVEVAGRRYAVRPGWNRLQVGLRDVRSLRVRIAGVTRPPEGEQGPGGIRELRIRGVAAREALRPPVLAERALAGRDLRTTGLTYLFERTTGDDPFRREPRRGTAGAALVRDRLDGERGLERLFSPPAARRWRADAWGTVASSALDSAIDDVAGVRGGRFESSGRFHGRPAFRASGAFDGGPRPWIGSWIDGVAPDQEPAGNRGAWLQWTVPRTTTIRRLRLEPPRERVRRATLVRVRWGARAAPAGLRDASPPLEVQADGAVRLPRAARGRTFRLEILRAAFPPGTPGRARQRRAVGIAELRGDGLPRVEVPRVGALPGRCGDLAARVGGTGLRMRLMSPLADVDAGRPLRFRACGNAEPLPAGETRLSLPAGTFAPYLVRLRSAAPRPVRPASVPGRVVDPGEPGRNARRDVRLDLVEPGWLVLGQSFGAAWQASCDGRDLGEPRPVDGYAMAWRVPAGCELADMSFGPDGAVRAGYLLSAPVLLALLLLLVVRRPPAFEAAAPPPDLTEAPVRRLPPARAALLALGAGAGLGFVFAARSAPLIAVATFVVLWRGIPVRALVAAAGALLLVAVPVLTLAIGVEDRGGYNPEYAQVRIAVHWVAVAAVVLLTLALARVLDAARRRRSPA